MFEPPIDPPSFNYTAEEEISDENGAPGLQPFDLSHIILRKMIHREEFEFLEKCRATISELTGEEFIVAEPPWLKFAGIQLQSDAYCESLQIAINYEPCILYELPIELHGLYEDRDAYMEFITYVAQARFIGNTMNGVALIPLPQMMSDTDLRTYLRNQLHALTKFRVWVGSPRCKCPSMMAADYVDYLGG